jgi:hypothetical protein
MSLWSLVVGHCDLHVGMRRCVRKDRGEGKVGSEDLCMQRQQVESSAHREVQELWLCYYSKQLLRSYII